MTRPETDIALERRAILGGLGAGLALALGTSANAAEPGADPAVEAEKEKIVTDFCKAWAKRDADALTAYLADDVEYHMFEGRPPINGLAEFSGQLKPFMASMREIDWEILRSTVMGDVVLNERIDHFLRPDGSQAPDNHFHVVGVFLVREGKIKYWKDYNMSGSL
ncbi:MAG: SnoaL-like domain-containing protein [Rhodospirillaceae bacterium]|jgi:limonene-1,2-epoxide hydrolase|nr:SnoaL-like domain-containing protein [Rhodospirillaceae bacterium]MBT5239400.1 SnoaL-like domain-containing protein [Rhodospirillaceae bacterium]MBT5564243.1 SnoaL-like domain-containing protein [Rhodospirillaceae bacterium]MBT6088808.1 SnoaL-like domain-containing protein [Rhodospirillaceae bacterium]MBT7450288.1 SnoaL-like domain-containing protein [Rhodospirillaceae bacterium]